MAIPALPGFNLSSESTKPECRQSHLIGLCDVCHVDWVGADWEVDVCRGRVAGEELWILVVPVLNVDGQGGGRVVPISGVHFLKHIAGSQSTISQNKLFPVEGHQHIL